MSWPMHFLHSSSSQACLPRNDPLCVCVRVSHSVVSNSLQPHGLQPTRLPCAWNFPGKNTGVPFPTPGDLPDPRDQNRVSCIAGRFFTISATRDARDPLQFPLYHSQCSRLCFRALKIKPLLAPGSSLCSHPLSPHGQTEEGEKERGF